MMNTKTSKSLGRELIRVFTSFLIEGIALIDFKGLKILKFLNALRFIRLFAILKTDSISNKLKVKSKTYLVTTITKSIIFQESLK